MSSSHPTQPDVRSERRVRVSRCAQALSLFAAGVLLGALLTALPRSLGAALVLPFDADGADGVARVAGWDATSDARQGEDDDAADDSDAEGERERQGESRRARKRQRRVEEKAPVEAQAAEPSARKPSEIARRALGFTAFVRGGRIYGAGVLVDDQGHVLTCHHVIEGLDRISVSFSDGVSYAATVVDSDPQLDVALLQIAPGRRPEFEPASVTDVELGEDVFAIGAPRKMAFSITRGMASFIGRPFNGAYYLQTDVAMNAGSSGGPILNDRGEVIAISSFVLRDSEGLAFALPIDYAYRRFRDALGTPKTLEGTANDAFEGWLSTLDRRFGVGSEATTSTPD